MFSVIVDKIDSDKDSFVNLSELKNWIQFTQRRYIDDDVDRQWRQYNPDNEVNLNWEVYKKNLYVILCQALIILFRLIENPFMDLWMTWIPKTLKRKMITFHINLC